jgi:hypothetical protein
MSIVFRLTSVTDIPPNSISPLHRTVSLDYGIRMRRLLGGRQVAVTEPLTLLTVFKGSKIILHLEEGRKVEIGNGDIVGMLKRSQNHAGMADIDNLPSFSPKRHNSRLGEPYR